MNLIDVSLRKLRGVYPFEVLLKEIPISPDKLEGLMRGDIAYKPFSGRQEYYYFFELETDAEYFKRKYVSNF